MTLEAKIPLQWRREEKHKEKSCHRKRLAPLHSLWPLPSISRGRFVSGNSNLINSGWRLIQTLEKLCLNFWLKNMPKEYTAPQMTAGHELIHIYKLSFWAIHSYPFHNKNILYLPLSTSMDRWSKYKNNSMSNDILPSWIVTTGLYTELGVAL